VNTGEVLLNSLHLQNSFAHSNITFLIHCVHAAAGEFSRNRLRSTILREKAPHFPESGKRRENETFRVISIPKLQHASCYTIINLTKKIKLFFSKLC
jgi:hypothetical protein